MGFLVATVEAGTFRLALLEGGGLVVQAAASGALVTGVTGTVPIVVTPSGSVYNVALSVDVDGRQRITFASEVAQTGAASVTLDWRAGPKQSLTLTGDATLSFDDPPGPCNMLVRLIQGTSGSHVVSWPSNVNWVGSEPPTLSTSPGAVDIVSLYFDGANYWASFGLNFGPPPT